MIVLDASVLIGYFDSRDAHHGAAVELLEREVDDDFSASVLTLAEVLVGPARAGRAGDAAAALTDLQVDEEALPVGYSIRLAELRASTGLRMPDCCVLLTAYTRSARVASFDGPMLKAARKLGLEAIGA